MFGHYQKSNLYNCQSKNTISSRSKRQSYEILRSSLVQNLRNGGLNRQITPKQNELEREEDLVGIMKSEDLKSGDLKSDSVAFKKESSNKMLSSLSDS